MDVRKVERGRAATGYSLVSLLMTVVILGALMAAAIVGVSSMTGGSNGSSVLSAVTSTTRGGDRGASSGGSGTNVSSGGGISASSACKASADAAKAGSALYFASSEGASFPVKWSDMTSAKPPLFTLAPNVVINPSNPTELEGPGWKMVMAGGGTRAPTFTCST
jgi:hypothetical protein